MDPIDWNEICPYMNIDIGIHFKRLGFYKWAQLKDLRASTKRKSDSQYNLIFYSLQWSPHSHNHLSYQLYNQNAEDKYHRKDGSEVCRDLKGCLVTLKNKLLLHVKRLFNIEAFDKLLISY